MNVACEHQEYVYPQRTKTFCGHPCPIQTAEIAHSELSTFQSKKRDVLPLVLEQKVLTMGAPKSLLCAVASELRRAKMEGEKRERWMRLCVDVADEQDSDRLLNLISLPISRAALFVHSRKGPR